MHIFPRLAAWTLAVCVSACAAVASAQEQPHAAARAAALADEGRAALAREDWLGAYDLYAAAWEQYRDPSFAYNLAGISETVGRLAEALTWYETYLQIAPTAPDASEVQAAVVEITDVLERTWTRLRVTSSPTGASAVLVRANTIVPLGPTPVEAWAEPGRVTIELELGGYATIAEPIELRPGATAAWAGVLPLRPDEPGTIRRGAADDDDNRPAGEGLETAGVAPGPHVDLTAAPSAIAERTSGRPDRRRVVLLSVGGAGVVASAACAWLAVSATADFNAGVDAVNPSADDILGPDGVRARAGELNDLRDRARNSELAAWTLGASGLALTLAGALLPSASRDPLTRGIRLGPNHVMVRW